jgi:hypothetical protein
MLTFQISELKVEQHRIPSGAEGRGRLAYTENGLIMTCGERINSHTYQVYLTGPQAFGTPSSLPSDSQLQGIHLTEYRSAQLRISSLALSLMTSVVGAKCAQGSLAITEHGPAVVLKDADADQRLLLDLGTGVLYRWERASKKLVVNNWALWLTMNNGEAEELLSVSV